jgi:hypothetical protein
VRDTCRSCATSTETTKHVFDGHTQTIVGPVVCHTQPDGKLLFSYPRPPTREEVGPGSDVRGFVDDPDAVTAVA